MSFLETYLTFIQPWKHCFPQYRTFILAVRLSLSSLCTPSRGTISQAITFCGRDQIDWSSDYKFFSRSDWDPNELFLSVIEETLTYFKGKDYIAIAFDETKIKKTGKKIPGTQYHRDPLSPPFRVNFIYGFRILQASVCLPLYNAGYIEPTASRGVPVLFENAPVVKKPGKRATEAEKSEYKKLKQQTNLSNTFLENLQRLRMRVDLAGGDQKTIIALGDGSFCNKTTFDHRVEKTNILVRCRKDTCLCFEDKSTDNKRFYSKVKFSPESVRKSDEVKWSKSKVFIGGRFRMIRYKEASNVLWQRGAKKKPLRLIVIAGIPYRNTKNGKVNYRGPAYLLTDNLEIPVRELIQMYIDRWQIEVNFRDEKTVIKIGEAQVWNTKSVSRQPAFVAASYSMLILASLKCRGPNRTDEYFPLPKWRRKSNRPSCNDLVSALTSDIVHNKKMLSSYGMFINEGNILEKSIA